MIRNVILTVFSFFISALINGYELINDMYPIVKFGDHEDSILFVGDSQVFFGDSLDYGFIQLMRQSKSASEKKMKFHAFGKRNSSIVETFTSFDTRILSKWPSTLVFMSGIDEIMNIVIADQDSFDTNEMASIINSFRISLESIIHRLNEESKHLELNLTLILCSPTLIGDNYDDGVTNRILEEFSSVVSNIASEYNYKFIDLRNQILKYLEMYNPLNLPHSILTYDGYHMNKAGHSLVACIILRSLGLNYSDIKENIASDPQHISQVSHIRKSDTILNEREDFEIEEMTQKMHIFESSSSNIDDETSTTMVDADVNIMTENSYVFSDNSYVFSDNLADDNEDSYIQPQTIILDTNNDFSDNDEL